MRADTSEFALLDDQIFVANGSPLEIAFEDFAGAIARLSGERRTGGPDRNISGPVQPALALPRLTLIPEAVREVSVSDHHPSLVERHFFGAAVVKLRRARRGMVRRLRGFSERNIGQNPSQGSLQPQIAGGHAPRFTPRNSL